MKMSVYVYIYVYIQCTQFNKKCSIVKLTICMYILLYSYLYLVESFHPIHELR